MRRLIGVLNLMNGAVFVVLSLWVLVDLQTALKSGDLSLVIAISTFCLWIGVIGILISLALLERLPLSPKTIVALNILAIVPLLMCFAIGLFSDEPSSAELVLLLVPAMLLTSSFAFLGRTK
jgi:hypothetical protein